MDTSFTADDKLVLTNLSKVFWPEQRYTKGDLIAYYREIALVILPYLADRPQVLHRHVDGHSGKEFYQRTSRQSPSWLRVVRLSIDGDRRMRDFHLCQDWPSLLWMANFGCIEFGPWASRVGSLDRPDYLVIDLDPGDVPFSRVIEVAIVCARSSTRQARRPAARHPGNAVCTFTCRSARSTASRR
jgi:bifunctional non-homologous end joining protein LigD